MSLMQVSLNLGTMPIKKVLVEPDGTALSAGYTKVGTFNHPNPNDQLGFIDNHVLFHHVRDILYKVKGTVLPPVGSFWPDSITDMQTVQIKVGTGPVRATAVALSPKTKALTVGQTQQLTATFTPADTANKAGTYASYDATIASVTAGGLVTAKKAGVCGIQFTSADGGYTDVSTFTIT